VIVVEIPFITMMKNQFDFIYSTTLLTK